MVENSLPSIMSSSDFYPKNFQFPKNLAFYLAPHVKYEMVFKIRIHGD